MKVTLVRSTIGSVEVQKRTVKALGLYKIGEHKIHTLNPAMAGMIFRVKHLVKVEEI